MSGGKDSWIEAVERLRPFDRASLLKRKVAHIGKRVLLSTSRIATKALAHGRHVTQRSSSAKKFRYRKPRIDMSTG